MVIALTFSRSKTLSINYKRYNAKLWKQKGELQRSTGAQAQPHLCIQSADKGAVTITPLSYLKIRQNNKSTLYVSSLTNKQTQIHTIQIPIKTLDIKIRIEQLTRIKDIQHGCFFSNKTETLAHYKHRYALRVISNNILTALTILYVPVETLTPL